MTVQNFALQSLFMKFVVRPFMALDPLVTWMEGVQSHKWPHYELDRNIIC